MGYLCQSTSYLSLHSLGVFSVRSLCICINITTTLKTPFQKGWYKTPEMKGRYSIKNVLPALVLDHSYDHLAIKNGGDASSIFTAKLMGSF